jgi:hypothetical protein
VPEIRRLIREGTTPILPNWKREASGESANASRTMAAAAGVRRLLPLPRSRRAINQPNVKREGVGSPEPARTLRKAVTG